ncbi:MAG: hypothetical protein AB1765_09035, partial [Candidatus Hydrogenedentota bacterium]
MYKRLSILLIMFLLPTLICGINIKPGDIQFLEVSTPQKVIAGSEFEVIIIGFDGFGHKVSFIDTGIVFRVKTSDNDELEPGIFTYEKFKNGVAKIKTNIKKAGKTKILVEAPYKFIKGESKEIIVSPDSINYLSIATTLKNIAGSKFRIKISAYDKYQNFIKELDQQEIEFFCSLEGETLKELGTISSKEFIDGFCEKDIEIEKSGIYRVVVKNTKNPDIKGVSASINIESADLSKLDLIVPSEVRVADEFNITIILKDKFDNIVQRVANFDEKIYLSRIDNIEKPQLESAMYPENVSLKSFAQGIAKINCFVKQTGEFRIRALVNKPVIETISEKIISLPGKPAGFEFKVIKDEVYSGEAFEFELNIVDKFNNRVDVKPLLKEISDTRIYLKIISGMEEKFSS